MNTTDMWYVPPLILPQSEFADTVVPGFRKRRGV